MEHPDFTFTVDRRVSIWVIEERVSYADLCSTFVFCLIVLVDGKC